MTRTSAWSLYWAPRVLSILFIAFLSMFALDVFGEAHGFWQTLLALTIHLIPSIILIFALILAWRWEWVGALLYAVAGTLYVLWVLGLAIRPTVKLNWIACIAGPAFVVAALFLVNWLKRAEIHPTNSNS